MRPEVGSPGWGVRAQGCGGMRVLGFRGSAIDRVIATRVLGKQLGFGAGPDCGLGLCALGGGGLQPRRVRKRGLLGTSKTTQ